MRKQVSGFVVHALCGLTVVGLLAGCSGSSGSSSSLSYSADTASKVIAGVGSGVSGTGQLMAKSSFGGNAIAMNPPGLLSNMIPRAFASGEGLSVRCNNHGEPMNAAGTSRLTTGSADYVAMTFMCMMAYNSGSPDTIQGSYTQIKSISCAVERAGLVFDGAPHAISMTIDSNCFTSSQMSGMGVTAGQTMSVTATASKPWAVNTYYDAGVVLAVPSFGTFKYGAKVGTTKIEFAAAEDQTSVTPAVTGAYAGSWDRGTGELRFESRFDRFAASCGGSCSSSSQGWGRHFRLYAKMTADADGNPSGNLTTITGAYASVNKADDTYSSGTSATAYTVSGDLSGAGVKTKIWGINGLTSASGQAALRTFSGYSNFSASEGCYTTSSSAAVTCGAGLIPSGNFDFLPANTGTFGTVFTNPLTWLSGLTSGLTFTSVTVADVQ